MASCFLFNGLPVPAILIGEEELIAWSTQYKTKTLKPNPNNYTSYLSGL